MAEYHNPKTYEIVMAGVNTPDKHKWENKEYEELYNTIKTEINRKIDYTKYDKQNNNKENIL